MLYEKFFSYGNMRKHHRLPVSLISLLGVMLLGITLNAALVPLVSVVFIKNLVRSPWELGVYTFILMALTIVFNTLGAQRVRAGTSIIVLLMISAASQVIAALVLAITPTFWVLVMGLAITLAGSGCGVPLYYTLGRQLAEQENVDPIKFNTLLRTVTSLGWIIGPFVAFFAYAEIGFKVFALAVLVVSVGYMGLTFYLHNRLGGIAHKGHKDASETALDSVPKSIALGTTFFIFIFSFCHLLATTSLPVFFVTEAGFSEHLPGMTAAVKSAAEVAFILSSPMLMQRIGVRACFVISSMLAVIAYISLAQSQTIWQALVGAFLEGTYYGIFAGISLTYVQSLFDGHHTTANASYMNGIYSGVLLAGPLGALVAQLHSFQANIYLSAIIMLVWGACLCFQKNLKEIDKKGI